MLEVRLESSALGLEPLMTMGIPQVGVLQMMIDELSFSSHTSNLRPILAVMTIQAICSMLILIIDILLLRLLLCIYFSELTCNIA